MSEYRRFAVALVVVAALPLRAHAADTVDALFAENFEAAPDCSAVGLPGCPGFVLLTPPLPVDGGALADYCWYFRTPNAATLAAGRFSSRFDAAVEHIAVYTTTDGSGNPVDARAPGTLRASCGFADGANGTTQRVLYVAHETADQLRMPDDDGAGKPVAIELAANTAGFIEIVLLNASENALVAPGVRVAVNERSAGAYTKTASFMTYNPYISIAPNSSGVTATAPPCTPPASTKFWWFSTQTHLHATDARLSNGATTLVDTSNWQTPQIATYSAPDFYAFGASDKLTTACTYDNFGGQTIQAGDSYSNDEVCEAVTYFFPAGAPKLCFNGTVLP